MTGEADSASSNSRIVEFPAYGIPTHQIRVVGPENVTNHVEVIDVRIEPHAVLVGGHNDRHTVVQVGDERISSCCQNAATLNYLALGTFPLIPQSGECKELALHQPQNSRSPPDFPLNSGFDLRRS
jgi:hypothetical protein